MGGAGSAEEAGLPPRPPRDQRVTGDRFDDAPAGTLPKAGEVEFSIEDDAAIARLARAMFDAVLEMNDGRAVMPDRPGWDVRIKPDWLAAADRRIMQA